MSLFSRRSEAPMADSWSAVKEMTPPQTEQATEEVYVVEAENGQVALEAFQANAPDVVFSDWNMPQMNGLQLLQEIRKLNQKVPVIMVTTEGSREKVMSAIAQGVTDYLIKPFTPTTLRDKLSKWVAS